MNHSTDETTRLLSNRITSSSADEDDLEEMYHRHNLALPKGPILYSLWMGSFLGSLDSTIVANIMNKVAEEFEESDKKQWIVTSFLLTNTAFQPLYGKLSDLAGRKTALMVAHSFFLVGCLFTALSRNLVEFSIARAVCGMGAGGISALSSISVSDICTPKERGVYQGYANVVFGTGSMLGGPIGGWLMDSFGWKVIFAGQVPLIMTCMFLGYRNVNIKLLHVPPRHERYRWENIKRIDLGGSISLIGTISGFLCLCSTDLNKPLLATLTLLSLVLFIMNELYWAPERIIPTDLLSGTFGITSLLTVFSSFIAFGDVFRNPVYLQLVQNISPTSTGGFLLFSSISSALASLATGWILRNTSLGLATCSYLLITIAVCLHFISLSLGYTTISHLEPNPTSHVSALDTSGTNYWFTSNQFRWRVLYVIAMILNSWGYASLLVATLVSIVFTIPKSQQATITGCFYLWRSIGTVLGASSVLTIFESSATTKLYQYLHPINMDKEYESLIHDTSFLRNHFSGKILRDLLEIYNESFLISYIPTFAVSILALIIAFKLFISCDKEVTETKDDSSDSS
ncbi:Vba1p [Kluyveromyces lactis]|uniref:KLLA0F13684p n=1 Tax=Kluyveromyces lactis (strain ATCC 8585 / CBS 2359 / DSM 70799 / NBRC 1267 / NRRL Y-1140 / WM37) TaxID=284590 RepID=Q6CK43_KLULA|nr:uncharacterized protein KLLA0_F13684g [Kluyveromyces lactis]CAG98404.1 KLLA0F13684p [Kluyveromyces lactis]|eukprot:XP_455696.1 uncharacterized protein KLLA0_F13684g [Kluyveromyces lactis]